MFASLRHYQRNVDVLAREIRVMRTKFQPFETPPQKPRIEPPKPKRVASTRPKQRYKIPFNKMGQRTETGAEPRPSQAVEPDPLENEPILERRKLQALVSLYHQSRSFITREELDDRIDREFGYAERQNTMRLHSYTHEGLKRILNERRATPTYTSSPPLFTFDIDPKAGATRSRGLQVDRPQRLAGVMYGTDEYGEAALEAVEEAIQRGGYAGGIPRRKGI
jgi:hypothetical protein